MKYLEVHQISKVIRFLEKFEETNQKLSFELETHKCKFTRKQKNLLNCKSVLTYFQSSLNLLFPEYDFSSLELDNFSECCLDMFKNDLYFRVGNIVINSSENELFVDSICRILDSTIDFGKSVLYKFEKRFGPFECCSWFFCYLFYNRKRKRILIFSAKMRKF